ncbi:ras GEF [Sodiomyces alkalinus F11]|uniref:Ras GEF n=1 Tax=Sodiomyces alkalinus (strain CBS 110278 / VKM F-3762 / F11) TaxID=1314773 RepID=A0A3N2Q6M5_SODAK|nr:ras GEF [Sodiomyces alkalinus F11]ROT42421.1 ras GEF [Sodiomyces alkalinus F11]
MALNHTRVSRTEATGSPTKASPTATGLSTLDLSPQRDAARPSNHSLSPRAKILRDARFKRGSPHKTVGSGGKEGPDMPGSVRGPVKTRIPANTASAKPLLPVTERRSQEDKNLTARTRGNGSCEKADITPDGGSGGRDGRQFTVANVGNNGRIYLRPSVRPPHQRPPQPHFVFPMTPPATARLGTLAEMNLQNGQLDDFASGMWSPAPSTPATILPPPRFPGHGRRPTGHRRALSDSTTREDPDTGGLKVVISRPGEEQRPKTMEDMDPQKGPLLDVEIPSWRIGNPRFTLRGTPVFRGSSHAPTEEFPRSSNVSFLRSRKGELTPHTTSRSSKRPSPITVPQFRLPSFAATKSPPGRSPRLAAPYRSTYFSTHLVVEPAMFDALTFQPACDDKTIVRYSPTGAVTAATPPRLVAEITSPSFLDYELISDFFLTYRCFLEPMGLVKMLMARLRWALDRDDEVGLVVRVRTFVAIRHWILNYFVDDLVTDYALRVSFCNLLNDLVDELSQNAEARKGQLKILAELKKCWRRVCAQFWDGPEFNVSQGPDVPIAPGGIVGHRNPSLDPSFWEKPDVPVRLSALFAPSHQVSQPEPNFHASAGNSNQVTDSKVPGHRPTTPERGRIDELERHQTSPTSIVSVDVLSCSFPGKTSRAEPLGTGHPLAAHPVPSNCVQTNAPAVATTPRALTGKRARPSPSHKRAGSLSDSLREKTHKSPERSGSNTETEHVVSFPFPGSLVRGNLLPPGQPFVEIIPLGKGGRHRQRQTTVFEARTEHAEKCTGSAMSGQGMRKLIGSVRRALSTKGQGVSPTQGSFINIINMPALGPQGATTNRLPGTAVVPQARPRQTDVCPPLRIDLLGAQIAEDFKKAIREDVAAESERRDSQLDNLPGGLPLHGAIPEGAFDLTEARMEAHINAHTNSPLSSPKKDVQTRPMSDTGITAGSKSIVIVDDTFPPGLPYPLPVIPSSSLYGAHSSSIPHATGDVSDGMVPPSNADPTPPNTPPDHSEDTPQRLHPVPAQRAVRRSLSSDNLPPFVPDLATLGHGYNPRTSEDGHWPLTSIPSQPSTGPVSQSQNRHPLSSFGAGYHRRQRSGRTELSLNSILHRRVASIRTGVTRQSTIRSFDAGTYSATSAADFDEVLDDHGDAVPQPLRILRRRPGGDLRAATNVGELDAPALSRSRSAGSLTTYSESLRSSYLQSHNHDSSGFVDVASSGISPDHGGTFSLGALTEQPGKRKVSLISTHSSKPVMPPSFEAEAQKLAQIPDDDDDGGVESALAKLEGKYEKKTFKLSIVPSNPPEAWPEELVPDDEDEGSEAESGVKEQHRHLHVGDGDDTVIHHHHHHNRRPDEHEERHNGTLSLANTDALHVPRARPHTEARSFLSDNSGVSYSSIPLLERGFTDDGRSKTATVEWRDKSVLFGSEDLSPAPTPRPSLPIDSQHPSYEFVLKTRSMEKAAPDHDYQPPLSATQQSSFLEDDSGDDGTDLSSELSVDAYDTEDEGAGYVFAPSAGSPVARKLPSRPLGETHDFTSQSRPPSPPITLIQALQMSPSTANVPQLYDHQIQVRQPLTLTPDTTPTALQHPKESSNARPEAQDGHGHAQMGDGERSKKYSVHLPFILAFESEVLAEQFTLIEKDALNEIDWRELIEMNWKNAASNDSRSWVDFLRNTDAHGVEVVIARFNIMVKWACSEIVLTQNLEERAGCIIKFIHVAAHCRRHRNFATMSQITIALTSQEIARLTKTWEMVPTHDLKTLSELETLVSPMRNFYNLRAEMEGGSDLGCIPFVGIYTHDLLFNAQRPSEIASSPTTAPLVNFERCRYAACIVKTLLRLLEASTLYQFQPVEGITERCLWMSALSDDEIRSRSESLE